MKLKLFLTACFSLTLITACSPTPSEKAATEDVKDEAVVAKQNDLGDNSAHERSHEHSGHGKENELVHASHQHDEEHEEKHEHASHQHAVHWRRYHPAKRCCDHLHCRRGRWFCCGSARRATSVLEPTVAVDPREPLTRRASRLAN